MTTPSPLHAMRQWAGTHGSALQGLGLADCGSMIEAIRAAMQMVLAQRAAGASKLQESIE